LKIFKDQSSIPLGESVRLFVQEVSSFVARLPIESRQLFFRTSPSAAAFLATCNLLMCCFDLFFSIAIDTRVFYERSIRQSRKGIDAEINANFFFRWMKSHAGSNSYSVVKTAYHCSPSLLTVHVFILPLISR